MLILLALACTPLFPPLSFLVSVGGALYAHLVGRFRLRNVSLAFFVALLLVLGVLQGMPNL
jgi:uncharacterized protein (DUF952 family)